MSILSVSATIYICLFEHVKFTIPFRRRGYTVAGFMIPQRRFAAMDSARLTLVKNQGAEGTFSFLLGSLFGKIKAKRALTPIS
ncbi:MAG: hypothetical protein JW749_06025 [Sedimentisphaerales bacterium]|nr:hypothetical protein [Sedimentisphaerales bacterium]